MSQSEQGKIPASFFERVIKPHLGRANDSLLVGPAAGVDVSVVDIGKDQVLISTTDPIAINPPLGMERSAWLALHVIASDLATSGIAPQFISVNFSLPPSYPEKEFEEFWLAFHRACDEIGVSIVGGHTGRYDGCELPMVGSGTAFAVGDNASFITSTNSQPGDLIMMTKQAGLEAAVMLSFADRIRADKLIGNQNAEMLRHRFGELSVVRDAAIASDVGLGRGAVTAMHDATEGGLNGGLIEMADAAGVGLLVYKDQIPRDGTVELLCAEYGIDPLATVSEGCLILTAHPDAEADLVSAFRQADIPLATIGEVLPLESGRSMSDSDELVPLTPYAVDTFWDAYFQAVAASGQ